ncbi:uncharacterized protein LOC105204213 [Solenopsis invicta]|uniref:uncharacterized protein LOC105204213 n=1 Tax=Solenopsis invicta TaxID=13686 RepID=UPI00059621F3|nr:uncharacterized protein LOC105204213 [Solenopsis invicta]
MTTNYFKQGKGGSAVMVGSSGYGNVAPAEGRSDTPVVRGSGTGGSAELFSPVQADDSGNFKVPRVVSNVMVAPPLSERDFPPLPGCSARSGMGSQEPELIEVTPDSIMHYSSEEDESTLTDTSCATTSTTNSRKRAKNSASSGTSKVRKTRGFISSEAREDLYLQQQTEVLRKWQDHRSTPVAKVLLGRPANPGEQQVDLTRLPAIELESEVAKGMARLREVSEYKKGLKGTTQKTLREIATLAERAVQVLRTRTQSEEVVRLQEANERLRRDYDSLKRDLEDIKGQLASALICRESDPGADMGSSASGPSKRRWIVSSDEEDSVRAPGPGPSPPVRRPSPAPAGPSVTARNGAPEELALSGRDEKLLDVLLRKVGSMMDAKLEGIRDRLLPEKSLRPPLAFERGRGEDVGRGHGPEPVPQGAPPIIPQAKAKSAKIKPPTGGREAKVASGVAANKKTPPATKEAASSPSVSAPPLPQEFWVEVVGRKSKKKRREKASGHAAGSAPAETPISAGSKGASQQKKKGAKKKKNPEKKIRINVPKRAAIVLMATDKDGTSVADALARVRDQIDLRSMGIPSLRPRRALTGAIMYEVPGEQSKEGAEKLEAKLRELLNPEEVKVSRTTKTAELRLSGLDDLTVAQDVAEAMARVGGCTAHDVQVGTIRRPRNGLGSVWLRCPAAAASKLAQAGKVQVGWVMARVEALRPRPAQCFRCLRTGHTIGNCDSPVDRGNLCYRCGQPDHVASGCEEALRCPVCADLGRPAGHRFGGPACTPPPPAKKAAMRKVGDKEAVTGPSTVPQTTNVEGSSLEEVMDTDL